MCEARVLEIIGKRPVGGVGTVMLNYQRHMNMERVQMDYLIFGEQEETFDKEVKKLGSRVYTYPALSGRQMRQTKKYFEQFFSEHHSEYDCSSPCTLYCFFMPAGCCKVWNRSSNCT
mgnify:CR=1 FL=1